MFFVKDSSSSREQRILVMSKEDASISLLLSAIHFEWTIRRAIIALGSSPNVEVREKLENCHGLSGYKKLWKEEVFPRVGKKLPEIVANWEGLTKTFRLRNKLIHGVYPCGEDYAMEKMQFAIEACKSIRRLSNSHNVDLDVRLPIRRKPRS